FLLIAFFGVFFNFSYLVSTLLFFVPPAVYATAKRPDLAKPIGIFALAVGIPIVLTIDTLALYNHAWWETSTFSHRIFDLVPFETVLWAVLYAYIVPISYEYFFGRRKSFALPRIFWKFAAGLFVALVIFLFAFSFNREWFSIPYFYAVFVGLFYVLPLSIGLMSAPRKFIRLWMQCLLFSVLLLVGELGALGAHQWGFSGNEYLGVIHIGNLTFPFEEVIWILIGIPAFLYVYFVLTDREWTHG
ncbi:MAG: hypothetical protein NUV54_00615, partial [Candidatus Taylorbacteria bacterium]|nr:hypothetical protein [Candidatus Taylorbacteria bacterium]